jgi:hypothetical protein
MPGDTQTSFDLEQLVPYVGKTITLRYIEDGEEVSKTGEIKNLKVNIKDPLVFFNPRGRGVPILVEGGNILGFEATETRLRLVSKRSLHPAKAATVRRHLADAHGWSLDKVNGMSDEAALVEHERIDHDPLAHDHNDSGSNTKSSNALQGVSPDVRARIEAASLQRSA